MGKTTIEWADFTINPIRAESLEGKIGHYCEKISLGCKNCYASRLQPRFGMPEFPEARARAVTPFLDCGRLDEVRRRRIPTRYFWCDMTDLFGAWVPDEWIGQCFVTMAMTPQHVHLVLTKRPERMRTLLIDPPLSFPCEMQGRTGRQPLRNVWLGVSIEDQATADERIPLLLQTPAAVRWVSAEPLLSCVDLLKWLPGGGNHDDGRRQCVGDIDRRARARDKNAVGGACDDAAGNSTSFQNQANDDQQSRHREDLDPPSISWVVCGGESGPHARPMELAWARLIVAQCRAANVPVFMKQLGANPRWDRDESWRYLRDRKGGDWSEWPADARVREYP